MNKADQTVWLVVDEDRFSRVYLRSSLSRFPGIEVLEAESGLRAMEVLSATPVDAVILDVFSDFDGFAMVDLIRGHHLSAKAHVVITSKQATQASVVRASECGVSDYLVKPFRSVDTDKRLREIVDFVEHRRHIKPDASVLQRKRILVADDANFCSFSTTALTGRYDVKAAASLLDIVVHVNGWSPDLLLLNLRQRGMSWSLLQRQLQRLSLSRGLQIYLLGNEQEVQARAEGEYSGWLLRSFVPDEFCSNVASILEPGLLNVRTARAWLRNFAPEIASSVRQVLGMMTRVEPSPIDNPGPVPFDLLGSLRLRSKRDSLGMLLEMRCQRVLATKLAARLTGLEETDIDEELQGSGVTEVLNVVGGRLMECCRGRDLDLKIGLPILGLEPTPADEPIFRWEKLFKWGETDVFQIALRCYEKWSDEAGVHEAGVHEAGVHEAGVVLPSASA